MWLWIPIPVSRPISCILSLFKDVPPYNYFKYEVSEQDIQKCCKELFNNYDLRIVCTTPFGFPEAGIKAKLESFLSGK